MLLPRGKHLRVDRPATSDVRTERQKADVISDTFRRGTLIASVINFANKGTLRSGGRVAGSINDFRADSAVTGAFTPRKLSRIIRRAGRELHVKTLISSTSACDTNEKICIREE
ncbi:hypothetical protein EVAR_34343_1 [Eumeta japonica]|uniref:Uncharacterized protein n=1 Tax=Eumeta variegata TaxID=151549 RepID=A0A4C1VDB6_EUMVA|nr:hypothetical protein EVAR_34343_1 [Eumeta japonica]